MINERLQQWCVDKNIIQKEQIGFRKKSRPGDHIFVLKTLIDTYNNQGKKIYACFIDLQKAFDSVWRTGLLYKLIKYGFNLEIIKLMSMYEKTSQSLKIGNQITK